MDEKRPTPTQPDAPAGAAAPARERDWRAALADWLRHNPKTIPENLRRLREDFIRQFPKEGLRDLTLEEYSLGTGARDSLSHWLEYKTRPLGHIGGFASKFGVWRDKNGEWQWSKNKYRSLEDAFGQIKSGLASLVEAADARRLDELDEIGRERLGPSLSGLRSKPLAIYFPELFLPIFQPEHLANFLRIFGAEPRGEVLTRNRQLLHLMSGFPEFEGFDTFGMMRFLYETFPQSGEPKGGEVAVWKIAPGEGARYWDVCRERGAIIIGWLRDSDYRDFPDKKAVREALAGAGQRSGGASQIWDFTHGIKAGDIVVANKGLDTVVGVGKVTSNYLPPGEATGLVEGTDYAHARRIDWRINEPVTLPSQVFGQNTVTALDAPRWRQIRQAYLEQDPALEDVLAELEKDSLPPPRPTIPRDLRELMDITARTRNVLLYGPPGTGKTWLVNHFISYFLLRHNVSSEAAAAYWAAVARKDKVAARALRSQVRAEGGAAAAPRNFWWMAANEERTQWSWKILFEQGEWFFGKRSLARNFEAARPGDLVFGYQASPHMQLVALARVERGLETRSEDGERKEGVTIKPLVMFRNPLGWREVADNPELKDSEPVRLNTRGSMFSLTAEEARALANMLNEAGNDLSLPGPSTRGDFAEFVTFHQSFAYEEFVEGLRPVSDEATGGVRYEVRPGVFRKICARAEADWQTKRDDPPKHLLVIDEINRANIAKVLGELITLVEDDKRLGEANEVTVRLPYSGERFGVPPNLYILGTMNTADRSIALLDLALRRRFAFVEVTPEPSAVEPAEVAGVNLRDLLARLNERIVLLLDRDHRIGHSYFINLGDADHLHFAWYNRVVPLLEEYFYNDGGRLRAALGPRFVRPFNPPGGALGEHFEREHSEVARLEGDEFLDALRELAAGGGRGDDSV